MIQITPSPDLYDEHRSKILVGVPSGANSFIVLVCILVRHHMELLLLPDEALNMRVFITNCGEKDTSGHHLRRGGNFPPHLYSLFLLGFPMPSRVLLLGRQSPG
jgi:hypothetical protein